MIDCCGDDQKKALGIHKKEQERKLEDDNNIDNIKNTVDTMDTMGNNVLPANATD